MQNLKYLILTFITLIISSCSFSTDCEGPATKNTVKNWHECHGEYIFDGVSYEGGFRFGSHHGDGLLEVKENKSSEHGGVIFYEGEFNEGNKHGNGFARFTSKHLFLKTYDGEWKNDKFDGKGIATIQISLGDYDGEGTYEGQFRNGAFDGQGTLNSLTTNGDAFQFIGNSKNGKRHGKGTTTKTLSSGRVTIYTGDFIAGKKEGKGVLTIDDYYSYEGDFKNGKYDGQGSEVNKNAYSYAGGFKKDLRVGKGVYTSSELVLSGTFSSDNLATGTIEYDGKNITGNFITLDIPKAQGIDKIERYGIKDANTMTVVFNNGNIFQGKLNADLSLKNGSLEYLNGDMYKGEFENNLKHGNGHYEFINGDEYVGEFKNNKFNGKGLYRTDDETIQGLFKDNQFLK